MAKLRGMNAPSKLTYPACLHVDGEDAVGARGGLVHGRLADGAVGVAQEQLACERRERGTGDYLIRVC